MLIVHLVLSAVSLVGTWFLDLRSSGTGKSGHLADQTRTAGAGKAS